MRKLPIYEYRCLKCGHQFEKMQKISEDAVSKCEKCGERVTRVFHPIAIQFKGSGFYTTDYGSGRKSQGKSDDQKEKKDTGKDAKSEAGPDKKAASGASD